MWFIFAQNACNTYSSSMHWVIKQRWMKFSSPFSHTLEQVSIYVTQLSSNVTSSYRHSGFNLTAICYLNKIRLKFISFSCDYPLYGKALTFVLKWVIYLNTTLIETIHVSCDCPSYDRALISVLKRFIYWKRILVITIHLSFNFSFYHKALIYILKCIVYLNIDLLRTIHLSCGYLLYDRVLISILKWVIYSKSTLLKAIHSSYDIAHKASSQIFIDISDILVCQFCPGVPLLR
jgi:hypothetical protein